MKQHTATTIEIIFSDKEVEYRVDGILTTIELAMLREQVDENVRQKLLASLRESLKVSIRQLNLATN